MTHPPFRRLLVALLVLIAPITAHAHRAPVHEHAPLVPIPAYSQRFGPASGAAALEAAQAFLAILDASTREAIVLDPGAKIRASWSNLPAKFVTRGGLKLGEFSDEQIGALFAFLSASLGEEGYQTVGETLAAEAFLSLDPRAKRFHWSPSNYWFAFYGVPSASELWGWQFGGHHLAINVAIEQKAVTSLSPTFVGTEPAVFTYKGQAYEPVKDMHRAGVAVFASLTPEQQEASRLRSAPRDVLAGPGQDGVLPPLEGIEVKGWSPESRELLLAAINEWVSIQPEENASPRMRQLESQLDEMFFAWFGAADGSGESYFRVQGPTLVLELLSMTNNVGASAEDLGHYHTIYRNPALEYGRSPQEDLASGQ